MRRGRRDIGGRSQCPRGKEEEEQQLLAFNEAVLMQKVQKMRARSRQNGTTPRIAISERRTTMLVIYIYIVFPFPFPFCTDTCQGLPPTLREK